MGARRYLGSAPIDSPIFSDRPFGDWRIQGARFLIEWDSSGGNHIHSVWRDFDGDWGRDVLREHYQRGRAGNHRH